MVCSAARDNDGRHVGLPERADIAVLPCGAGDIKRIRGANSHFYYSFANRGGFVYERLVGTGSLNDMRLYFMSVVADAGWKPGIKILTDLRWAVFPLGFDEMAQFARDIDDFVQSLNAPSGTLALIAGDDLEFAMGRMYETVSEKSHKEAHVVRTIEAAVAQLDLDAEVLATIIATVDSHEPA